MATEEERQKAWRIWMNRNEESCNFTKQDLRAAVDAIDNYFNDNASTINQTLPVAFRTNASMPQKALLFALVTMVRYGDL